MLDATASHDGAVVDRRSETRVPTSGDARLSVLKGAEILTLPVSLIDVSRSGFQIESGEALEPFTPVELHLRTIVLQGAVGHCRPYNNRFRLGLLTTEMIDTARP